MFKLNPAPTFKASILVSRPGEEPKAITFEFRHKTRTGLGEWLRSMEGKSDAQVGTDFIAGWSGVIDSDGNEVAFSPELFHELCERYPAASVEVIGGYVRALTESRAKN